MAWSTPSLPRFSLHAFIMFAPGAAAGGPFNAAKDEDDTNSGGPIQSQRIGHTDLKHFSTPDQEEGYESLETRLRDSSHL